MRQETQLQIGPPASSDQLMLSPMESLDLSNLLLNAFMEEVASGNNQEGHQLLIISVHAVFLGSGFVCFQSSEETKINGFHLPLGWRSRPTVSVQYTLPQLLRASDQVVESVEIKIQSMGKFVYFHGSLGCHNNPVGFSRLDASRFLPFIKSICMRNETEESTRRFHEKELFELWKITKDGLVLPLLTDLCYKTGLEPPPCFTSLLADLKLKILEFLPGIDVARIGCVSSELKYLSSNNDLWEKKYMEEFSKSDSREMPKGQWKDIYMVSREKSKKIIRRIRRAGPRLISSRPVFLVSSSQ
ncbi:hypothetical protein ACHQM5_015305 [Ranunculus cassubicifolius]